MLVFEDVTAENWSLVENSILNSEQIFPEPLRALKEELVSIGMARDSIIKIAKADFYYIGNAIGYPLTEYAMEEHDLADRPRIGKMIYLFNFVIDPAYQGRGYGSKLLLEFIKTARERGFDRLFGYFRQNGSLALIKKLGAAEIKIYKNWFNSGEDFILCELDLHNVNIIERPVMEHAEVIVSEAHG